MLEVIVSEYSKAPINMCQGVKPKLVSIFFLFIELSGFLRLEFDLILIIAKLQGKLACKKRFPAYIYCIICKPPFRSTAQKLLNI